MAGYSVTYTVVDNATKQIDAINRRIQQLRAPMDRLAKSSQQFLDVSGLSKVAEGFKGVARAAGEVVSSLTRIVPILGTIAGAASIAGMARLVSQFTEWGAALRRDSDSLNITSQRLQAFQNASRLAGGSADDMTESLKDLQKAAADALLGRDPIAAQTFARAGIALRQANGAMRESVEILPEAMAYIDKFSNAQDRMQIATQLGSRRLYELYQTFRIAGRPMSEFIKEAEKLGLLNAQDQKRMLEYRQSVTRLSIAFENLGYVLGGTVADALEPLVKDFTVWARQNAPEIEKTIRKIGEDFKEWYKKGGWEDLKATLTAIWNTLKFIGQHAETIVTIFAIGWGIKAVAGVAQLTAALGYAGAGLAGAGGVGFLGALGVGAALLASMAVAWKLLHEGRGLPGTATDPTNPNRFGDPSVPAMPGGAGAPESRGGPGGTGVPNYRTGRGHGMTMPGNNGPGGKGGGGPLAEGAQTAISKAEGTFGPNGIDWNVQAGESPGNTSANLENMSIADVAKLRGPDFGGLQINRVHLQAGSPALGGLDPNTTKFSRDIQQQIAGRIRSMQGFGAWNGFRGKPELLAEAQRAQQAMNVGPTGLPPTGGAGRAGAAVDQMVAMAGTNGDQVREFLKDPNGVVRRDPDLGNWCAAYVSAYLQHAGLMGPNSLMARDFANWGDQVALEKVRKGDLLVNKDLSPGNAHVGVATGRTRQGEGGTEVETISSNSIGPEGVENLPGLRWRSDVNARRSKQLAKMQEDALAKAAAAPKPVPVTPAPVSPPVITPPQGFAPKPAAAAGGMPDIRNIGPPDGPRGMAYIFGNKIPRPKLDAKGKILAYPPQTDAKGNVIGPNTYTPAQGPRAELNGGGRGANGEVNVTVTHKNPPPGAQMRATGKGDGMNIAPVRTEYQDLAVV